MAEFADMGDPTQLYMAIEKAYCEDRWPDVLEQGQTLLDRLPADDLGMRQRLQLLLAHTHLYGFGDRDSAGDLYRSVQDSPAETALRQIAAQGLQQCALPAPPPTVANLETSAPPEPEEEAEPEEMPVPGETTSPPTASPVIPWLESPPSARKTETPQSGAPGALIPDVIEESELIEVHQADPALAEELELKETPADPKTAQQREEDPELLKSLLKIELF